MDFESIKRLLLKAMEDVLSDLEQEQLMKWRKEKVVNEQLYQRVIDKKYLGEKLQCLREIDVEQAFIRNQKLLKRGNRKKIWYLWPATVACCVAIGVYVLCEFLSDRYILKPESVNMESKKAELILDNGELLSLTEFSQHLKLDAVTVDVTGNTVTYKNDGDTLVGCSYNVLRIPRGGEYSVVLSDGTHVWLNAMSELRYPVRFTGDCRMVELKGEAYFEVAENIEKPFIVRTGDCDIQVLGTSFCVSAYQEAACVWTTLCTGKVRVTDAKLESNACDITPGRQVVFNKKERHMEIRVVDPRVYTAWTRGYFQFDNQAIEDVFEVLKRWYDIEVIYQNKSVAAEIFTGKLPRFDDLQVIIDLLEKVSDLEIERKGNELLVKLNRDR